MPVGLRASIRFLGELEDHLPSDIRSKVLPKSLPAPGSLKDFVESFGVPHTEVESLSVNGKPAHFRHIVEDGDVVEAIPFHAGMDAGAGFVLDVHLGRLAAFLRMLGFDTLYRTCFEDAELARISSRENRALLTRDRRLLMRAEVRIGRWLRNTDSRLQTVEVVDRFGLKAKIKPWTRCMACNRLLQKASKNEVAGRIPPRTADSFDEFAECSGCGRVYWKGSHYRRMQEWLSELTGRADALPEPADEGN